jgi:predicted RNA binding protein YcfA (HicA-like mRNA interferase family)
MKSVSGKEMARILERRGWVATRSRGSHRRYEKTGYPSITIPIHGNKSLKSGLQHRIMKDAGLTEADL